MMAKRLVFFILKKVALNKQGKSNDVERMVLGNGLQL